MRTLLSLSLFSSQMHTLLTLDALVVWLSRSVSFMLAANCWTKTRWLTRASRCALSFCLFLVPALLPSPPLSPSLTCFLCASVQHESTIHLVLRLRGGPGPDDDSAAASTFARVLSAVTRTLLPSLSNATTGHGGHLHTLTDPVVACVAGSTGTSAAALPVPHFSTLTAQALLSAIVRRQRAVGNWLWSDDLHTLFGVKWDVLQAAFDTIRPTLATSCTSSFA